MLLCGRAPQSSSQTSFSVMLQTILRHYLSIFLGVSRRATDKWIVKTYNIIIHILTMNFSISCPKIGVHPPVQAGVTISHAPSHPRQQNNRHDNEKNDGHGHHEVSSHYHRGVVTRDIPMLLVPGYVFNSAEKLNAHKCYHKTVNFQKIHSMFSCYCAQTIPAKIIHQKILNCFLAHGVFLSNTVGPVNSSPLNIICVIGWKDFHRNNCI